MYKNIIQSESCNLVRMPTSQFSDETKKCKTVGDIVTFFEKGNTFLLPVCIYSLQARHYIYVHISKNTLLITTESTKTKSKWRKDVSEGKKNSLYYAPKDLYAIAVELMTVNNLIVFYNKNDKYNQFFRNSGAIVV